MTSATRTRTGIPHHRAATFALIGVTAVWGSTFPIMKDLIERVPVADFLAVRFAIAAVALAIVAPRAVARLTSRQRAYGAALGLVYGVAQLLQTYGLAHTAASVSGFITGMYIVLTPVLAALIFRQRIPAATWLAVALAATGLGVMSLRGFAFGFGESITLLSAVFYALHIVGLGRWSRAEDAYGLAVVQMVVIALVCAVGAVPDGLTLPSTGVDWAALLYMALLSGALALVVQTWAQAHMTATRAAIVMTMEPVFAAGFAVALSDEQLGPRTIVGGGLVLAAMYLVELRPAAPPAGGENAGVPVTPPQFREAGQPSPLQPDSRSP